MDPTRIEQIAADASAWPLDERLQLIEALLATVGPHGSYSVHGMPLDRFEAEATPIAREVERSLTGRDGRTYHTATIRPLSAPWVGHLFSEHFDLPALIDRAVAGDATARAAIEEIAAHGGTLARDLARLALRHMPQTVAA